VRSRTASSQSPHLTHSEEQILQVLSFVLMSCWIAVLANALYQFMVADAVAEYYCMPYTHVGGKLVGCCAIWVGVYFGLVLHGGLYCFGVPAHRDVDDHPED